MKRIALCIALVFPTGLMEAGSMGPSAITAPAPACRVTIKAHLRPNALGSDKIILNMRSFRRSDPYSRVKIRGGSWSRIGNSGDVQQVIFFPNGTWQERVGDAPASGSGEWTGGYTLNMGCRYRRRYEFSMSRHRASGGVTTIAPQWPSTSSWWQYQTLDLGNLAKYF